jgi:DNA repair protein RadD
VRHKSRPYQRDIIRGIQILFNKNEQRVVLQLPTGAGKTHIATELIAMAGSSRCLYVVPSRVIMAQTEAKLSDLGEPSVRLAAGDYPDLEEARIVLASSHTLVRRFRGHTFDEWAPDIIIWDEAHRLIDQQKRVLGKWQSVAAIGLTATPIRLDGEPLIDLYPRMLCGPSISELQQQGFLVPARTYEAPMPDLSTLRTREGEWEQKGLESLYSSRKMLRQLVGYWKKCAAGRKTLAYTVGVAASLALRDAFRKEGIAAEHVDGTTTAGRLSEMFAALRDGRIQVLCNCQLLTEGLNVPEADCVQLATSTKSLARYLQMVGRGLRPAPQKRDLVILDHGGNAYQHDLVEAERDWHRLGKTYTTSLKRCWGCGVIIQGWLERCPACYRDPRPFLPPAAASRARQQRATSRAIAPREAPRWARPARRIWARLEKVRHAEGLPLSYTESKVRKAL